MKLRMSEIKYIDKNTICAFGDDSDLVKIREFISQKALDFGFNDLTSHQISLAVDEACSNLIKHAYNFDKSKKICINIDRLDKEFIVKIADEGSAFNPIQIDSPDMNEYFKNFNHGGLGIFIIKKVMDKINYFPSTDSNPNNILELRKELL